MLSNRILIQKSGCKKQKPKRPYLITEADHRKAIKVTKVLCVKCAPVNIIAKRIVMAHNNRYLFARYGYHHWSRLDPKSFERNRNKIEKIQEKCILAVWNNYSNNYSELLQNFGFVSMKIIDCVLKLTKFLRL